MSDQTDGMLNPHQKFKKFWCGFDAFTDAITASLFTLGAIAMFLMVVTRYGFSWSDPSVEILVRYSGTSLLHTFIYYLVPLTLMPIFYFLLIRKFKYENLF